MVYLVGSAGVDVEGNAKIFKGLFIDRMVTVYHCLRSNAFVAGLEGDGHAVFVRSANGNHIPSLVSQVAHINVGWNVDPGQMPQVKGPIGIGQCRGDQGALVFFVGHCVSILGAQR